MMETIATPGARPRILPARDARGRFVARPGAATEASRVRVLLTIPGPECRQIVSVGVLIHARRPPDYPWKARM